MVTWSFTEVQCYKLNINGASLHNHGFARRGGVIRDSNGGFVTTFAKHFGVASNNYTEFQALEEGILLVIQMSCFSIQIESDSSLLVDAIQDHCSAPWKLRTIVDNCRSRLSVHMWTITQVFCETNMVAGAFAKQHLLMQ
ncbi:uncharacterized protein LOC105420345, partial [Amborella trichopoda]|uniref:uncharacterized protein LOC105420345 n=1 Tax=Amborella trichopoda TaxID=13333 RepID=UPI0005D2F45A